MPRKIQLRVDVSGKKYDSKSRKKIHQKIQMNDPAERSGNNSGKIRQKNSPERSNRKRWPRLFRYSPEYPIM